MDGLYHLGRILEVGGVRSVSLGLHAHGFDFFGSILGVLVDYQVRKCYIGAFSGELQCDSLTDTTCGTGYDGCFSS